MCPFLALSRTPGDVRPEQSEARLDIDQVAVTFAIL
jgi:hypothetical protein